MDAARLSAQQQSKLRRLSTPQESASQDQAEEINIVPFLDMVVNIMMFVLATIAVTFVSSVETRPPFQTGTRPPPKELNLAIMLTNEGIAIKTSQGNVAPGCDSYGSGLALPAKGKDAFGEPMYDSAALTECVTRLKALSPAYQSESQVRIAASNNISYRKVVDCVDHVRTGPAGEDLFPEILFAMPR